MGFTGVDKYVVEVRRAGVEDVFNARVGFSPVYERWPNVALDRAMWK